MTVIDGPGVVEWYAVPVLVVAGHVKIRLEQQQAQRKFTFQTPRNGRCVVLDKTGYTRRHHPDFNIGHRQSKPSPDLIVKVGFSRCYINSWELNQAKDPGQNRTTIKTDETDEMDRIELLKIKPW